VRAAPDRLSARQARLLHLAAQGLLTAPRRKARAGDVLEAIRRMQLLQIDTIHVVARSPYFVLFSRLGAYAEHWLDALLEAGAIFESWAHEACFVPIEDYALHRAHLQAKDHWAMKHARRVRAEHAAALDRLLEHIRSRGPVKAADFDARRGRADSWWGWRDEKRWLETLFATGELMIRRRERFQRVYDLRERVLPDAVDRPLPTPDEAHAAFVEKAVKALGIAQARWIHDYFRTKPRLKDRDLDGLVGARTLLRVPVQGWDAPGYVHTEHHALLVQAAADKLRANNTTLLSPFDPVVWDRERALSMFGFDYRLECYVPAPKRTYGYFVLPVLRCGELIGRLDAKAHRAAGTFEVRAFHLEPGAQPSDALLRDVGRAIRRCAGWHGAQRVTIGRTRPGALRAKLARAVR
jgi:hypothetical protein